MNIRLLIAILVALVAGVLVGRFGLPSVAPAARNPGIPSPQPEVWTCSMHPQVRLGGPGNCPICEMPLIPAGVAQPGGGTPSLQFSEQALAMAGVETAPVTRRPFAMDLRAVGKIRFNESSLAAITARIDGYVERLFVDVTGVDIRAGDHVAEIYSPALLVAQQELIQAVQGAGQGSAGPLVEAIQQRLQRWGLTAEQIRTLRETGRMTDRVTLYSPIDGTVIEKAIVRNSSFRAGDTLYRVANLDTVWVYLDIYEYDLPWIRYGQAVTISAEARPGRIFSGMVTFVQPLVDEQSRTVRVPVHIANADHALMPGMFVSAVIHATLDVDGTAAPTGIEGQFACTMHPQVLQPGTGICSICEMPLARIPGAARAPVPAEDTPPVFQCPMRCEGDKTYAEPLNCPVCNMKVTPLPAPPPAGSGLLAVPVGAVLDSGTRTLVYVEKARGLFEPREVVLGPRSGDAYPVLRGLREGERVAARGGFLLDSQFQVTGHASLFYPGGLAGDANPRPAGEDPRPPHEHP